MTWSRSCGATEQIRDRTGLLRPERRMWSRGDARAAEQTRNGDSKNPELSDDPDFAKLQKQVDVPRPLAEQAARERRRRDVRNATLE